MKATKEERRKGKICPTNREHDTSTLLKFLIKILVFNKNKVSELTKVHNYTRIFIYIINIADVSRHLMSARSKKGIVKNQGIIRVNN